MTEPEPLRWDLWLFRRVDWTLASGMLTFAGVLYIIEAGKGDLVGPLPILLGWLLPVACLGCRPTVASMLALMLFSSPCCFCTAFYCDFTRPALADDLAHEASRFLLFVPLYGFLRAVHVWGH